MKFFLGCAVLACFSATSTLAATFSSSAFAQINLRAATFVDSKEDALPFLAPNYFDDTFGEAFIGSADGETYIYPDFVPFPVSQGSTASSVLNGGPASGDFGRVPGFLIWGILPKDRETVLAPIDLVLDYIIQVSASSIEDSFIGSYSRAEIDVSVSSARASDYFSGASTDLSGPYIDESLNLGFEIGKEGSEIVRKTGSWTYRMSPSQAVEISTVFFLIGETVSIEPAPVPIPASLPLLAFGMVGLFLFRLRRG